MSFTGIETIPGLPDIEANITSAYDVIANRDVRAQANIRAQLDITADANIIAAGSVIALGGLITAQASLGRPQFSIWQDKTSSLTWYQQGLTFRSKTRDTATNEVIYSDAETWFTRDQSVSSGVVINDQLVMHIPNGNRSQFNFMAAGSQELMKLRSPSHASSIGSSHVEFPRDVSFPGGVKGSIAVGGGVTCDNLTAGNTVNSINNIASGLVQGSTVYATNTMNAVNCNFILPITDRTTSTPPVGSIYLDPTANKLWVYTGNVSSQTGNPWRHVNLI
mmetsp:Transcript_26532/g.85052  ORF Transcript_26532/g.85052 Transcript_26532/m.85052 type:complete len:278 (-) Transcript_26532:1459-2292(-)